MICCAILIGTSPGTQRVAQQPTCLKIQSVYFSTGLDAAESSPTGSCFSVLVFLAYLRLILDLVGNVLAFDGNCRSCKRTV